MKRIGAYIVSGGILIIFIISVVYNIGKVKAQETIQKFKIEKIDYKNAKYKELIEDSKIKRENTLNFLHEISSQ